MTQTSQKYPNQTSRNQSEERFNPVHLSTEQIGLLKSNGCTASNWNMVIIAKGTDLNLISNVEFEGTVSVGLLDSELYPGSRLRNVMLSDTSVGNGVCIRNIGRKISGAVIGDEVVIENVAAITYRAQAPCGIGTRVSVLDETGSREVIIYPGLSAQSAVMMARCVRSVAEEIYAQTDELLEEISYPVKIGDKAVIVDSGALEDVVVGAGVTIAGASHLVNGTILSTAREGMEISRIGSGVDAENFIIEDGVVDSGTLLRNCYVGQGVRLEKGFTAHDSLFFSNCSMENGEACALFAGPYSVSMHKGTLLIGCQTSFLNAGSSTNQSNHMYKLGPVHWGVMERGVKTSSNSYLMLGANIGAFSLLMGEHKTHPDSREFPFSYLFGDSSGATVVVPGIMLRSCGLMRDETKWPSRDRRRKRGIIRRDRVIFDVLNPCTVEAMIEAIPTIRELLGRPADDDRYIRYKGMKLSRASLERAIKLYYLGIMKYLSKSLLTPDTPDDQSFPESEFNYEENVRISQPWIDLAGQPIPRNLFDQAVNATSVADRESIFNEAFEDYATLQRNWIIARFPEELRKNAADIRHEAEEFDRLVEKDREQYREHLYAEQSILSIP